MYFTSAFPVTVDVGVRIPYKTSSESQGTSIKRRDVNEVALAFEDGDGSVAAEVQFYVPGGLGPDPTQPARVSLVPGAYKVRVRLSDSKHRSVQIVRNLVIEEEGAFVLDLR